MARMSRLLGAVCLGAVVTAAVAAAVATREYAPVHKSPTNLAASTSGRIMVKFKARSTTLSVATSSARSGPQAAAALGARLGMTLADGRVLGTRTQVMTAQGVDSATLAAAAAQDSDVEWAEVDHRRFVQTAPNDPLYPAGQTATTPTVGQWYLRAPDSTTKAAINMEPAWAITTNAASGTAASGSAIVIADVDTGITSHPDLASKLFANGSLVYGYDFVGYSSSDSTALATANDGNLSDPDPSDPGDWVTATENSTKGGPFFGCNDSGTGAAVAENSSWHGTQTAGILGAATNNGAGMAGVGYDTMIVPVRALGKCGGFDSDIIAAATWAGGLSTDTTLPTNTHPARVINMSLGGSDPCGSAYQEALTALRNAKVFVVVAAGNDDGLAVDAPANCQPLAGDTDQTPVVIAVAGIRQAGTKVGYSDIGPQVTIAAPAGNCVNTDSSSQCLYPILTTSNTGATSPVAAKYTTGGSDASLGTSFSTPMVAGTVALMLAANPALTNAQVISLLKSSATTFPTTSDSNTATFTVPTCTAPTSTPQDECICTTSTCGAGMLNAGAAVAAAASIVSPVAAITATTTSVAAGSNIPLSGATSTPSGLTYQWMVSSGGGFVSLTDTTSASVTVTGLAAGTATVTLTVTDASTGATASTSTTVTVTPATTTTSGANTTGGGGGSGGGAMQPGWLVALGVAGLLLAPRRRRRAG